MRAAIRGTGIYLPETVVDNHALARIMDTSDEWIQARTGIKELRFADLGSATSDMTVPAARQALGSGLHWGAMSYRV